jgi:hypothetical protein
LAHLQVQLVQGPEGLASASEQQLGNDVVWQNGSIDIWRRAREHEMGLQVFLRKHAMIDRSRSMFQIMTVYSFAAGAAGKRGKVSHWSYDTALPGAVLLPWGQTE